MPAAVAVAGGVLTFPEGVNALRKPSCRRYRLEPFGHGFITPTLFVPLPVKYRLHFGPTMRYRGQPTAETVARNVAQVRNILQELLQQGVRRRRTTFF